MQGREEKRPFLELTSFDTYQRSTLKNFKWQLKNFFDDTSSVSVSDIKERLADINAYENLAYLKPIKEDHIVILDDEKIGTKEAEKVVLDGEFFWEHAAAGEATRLGLGTKYILKLSDFTIEQMIEHRKNEISEDMKNDPAIAKKLIDELTYANMLAQAGGKPDDALHISLGTRHMLQMAFDIEKLAEKHGKKPQEVLAKQRLLMILNESTADIIIDDFIRYNYFGFERKNVLFMIQKSFHGIDIKDGEPFYDSSNDKNKRLHNHGQMAMQKTQDNVIFHINTDKSRKYLKSSEFENILTTTKDMLSYNIEDTDYLTNAIDWHSLALSLELGKKGYGMTMEIVAQNPLKPQKGGAAFWDDKKKRIVMIESNQLKGMTAGDIKYLNKNFNHYPNPVDAFREVKAGKLSLHVDVKQSVDKAGNPKNYVYFCTPQGDINFLVKTAYIMRKNLKPIANWKSAATTPAAVKACFRQDAQEGFRDFAERVLDEKFY